MGNTDMENFEWKHDMRVLNYECREIVGIPKLFHLNFHLNVCSRMMHEGVPDGSVVENLRASAGDTGLVPGPGRSHVPQSSQAPVQLLSGKSQLLGPRAATAEAETPQSLCSAARGGRAVRKPHSTARQ